MITTYSSNLYETLLFIVSVRIFPEDKKAIISVYSKFLKRIVETQERPLTEEIQPDLHTFVPKFEV